MKVKINSDVIMNEKDIKKDIEKFAKTCALTIVQEASRLIKKFAYKQMIGYYDEYEPRIYDRTNQMRDLSYKPFIICTGKIYEGGVIIHSGHTNHIRGTRKNGDEYSEEEIYDNVWIKGSHGWEKIGYGENTSWHEIQGIPDRINKLKRAAYSKEVKNKLLAKGMRKAKSQSYSILNFN